MKSDLEARIQNIEKTVGESPHEEEGGDEGDGDDGLASGELRGAGDDAVVNRLAASLLSDNLDSRWATTLLRMDLFEGRFLRTVHTEELDHGDDRTSLGLG